MRNCYIIYIYTVRLHTYMYICSDVAASPEHYKQFMAVLCGYIVEKQREVQGEELPFDLVFVSTMHSLLKYACIYMYMYMIYMHVHVHNQ